MNAERLNHQAMDRLLAAQQPWRRALFNAHVNWRRLNWQCVIQATLAAKRVLDVAISAIALLLLAPIFLLLAIIVKADGGPVFFRQVRVGQCGRTFHMLKLRSMCVDAESRLQALLAQNEKASGITFKMKDDPRITRAGRWLRKSSLDELPQFWNVLRGDMSLVGPRPPVPREVALYTPADRRRLLVKPGITCLWQVGERRGGLLEIGDRNAIDFPEQVLLDVRYIEQQTLGKDLWLLAKTVPAILFGKGM